MKIKIYEFKNNEVEAVVKFKNNIINNHNKKKYNEEEYKKYRIQYIKKRINFLKRFIKQHPNFFKTFITLTFEDQEKYKDKKEVLKSFRNFYKKIKNKYNFSYIFVLEKTQIGVYHIHLLTNLELQKYSMNDKRLNIKINNNEDAFGNYWIYGFINVQKINKSDNILNYIIKYMFKNIYEKRIFYSSYDIKLKYIILKVASMKLFISALNVIDYIEKEYYIFIRGLKNDFFSWLLFSNNVGSVLENV